MTRGDELGPLHGLPIGIKDIVATANIRTTYGSPLYADNVPTEDAEVVRRLKAAGAIVLAKTNTPEFAAGANTVNPVFGATRNPWNTALSPAGSSGGSAASRCERHAADRAGNGFRLLGAHPRRILRDRRHPPDARPHAELPDAAGLGSGSGARPPRPHR